MRHIDRSSEPPVLIRNKHRWLSEYLVSGERRPDSSKYAHREIRDYLKNMSSCKCFYCEASLRGLPSEVDHHIEVAIDKSKVFEWDNLFYACKSCNHKDNEFRIASSDTLNPCVNTDSEIADNITFQDECILAKNGSVIGENTIKKYHLDADNHDLLRIRQLRKIDKRIIEINQDMIKGGRQVMTTEEKESLRSFTYKTQPYSYMCEVYLKRVSPQIFEP